MVAGHLGAQRQPTLADVAAAAGVSRTTASRALAAGPNVSEEARRRVWAAAERLDFEPNRLARSLRRGSTMTVGVVVPDIAVAFYATALKGAQEALQASGYHVLVMNTDRGPAQERDALRTLRSHQVDGLLVATSGGYEDVGVPAVFFDNAPATLGAGAVVLANEEGIALLVEHLAHEHGHRRIAYIGPPHGVPGEAPPIPHSAAAERIAGFRRAMGRAGLPVAPEHVRTSDLVCSAGSAAAVTTELMALHEPPTAIVAGSDALAIGVLDALRGSARVPEDVALVCFDEPPFAHLLDPPVTSLDRHDRELGRRAAGLLLDVLAEGGNGAAPSPPPVQRVSLELRRRRSCGCAPAA
jgi:DNA-binding LacI/PurR family transcriptional regulator